MARVKTFRHVAVALSSLLLLSAASNAGASLSPIAQQKLAIESSLRTATASAAVKSSLATLASESWKMTSVASGCGRVVVSCSYGSGKKVVVIYGDSHATMWAVAVVPVLLAQGFKVQLYWMPGCTPGHIAVSSERWGCTDAWRQSVEKAITTAKVKPKAVILAERSTDLSLSNGGTVSAAALTAGLVGAINILDSQGSKVIILGDNPVMTMGSTYKSDYAPASCILAHQNDLRSCDTTLTASLTHTLSGAEKAAADATHATFIDTTPWLCSVAANRCPVILHNRIAYLDAYHLAWGYINDLQGVVSSALAKPLGY